MANVKVKTVGAVFNGQPIGSTVELTEAEAKHYEALGYVERVKETASKDGAKVEAKADAKKASSKDK